MSRIAAAVAITAALLAGCSTGGDSDTQAEISDDAFASCVEAMEGHNSREGSDVTSQERQWCACTAEVIGEAAVDRGHDTFDEFVDDDSDMSRWGSSCNDAFDD